jgi:hypothetical protein
MSMRSRQTSASLSGMEQLANLLVRYSVRIWENASNNGKDADIVALMSKEEAKKVLLGRSATSFVGHSRTKSKRYYLVG